MNKKKSGSGGIMDIDRYLKEQKKNGRKLFKLVTEETGDLWSIKSMATRESLLELILYTVDHALHMKAVGRGIGSRKTAIKLSDAETQKLFTWLDGNFHKYKNVYQAVDTAISKKIVIRSHSWVTKKITEYRKLKKAARN